MKTCDAFGGVSFQSSPLDAWLVKRDMFIGGIDTSGFTGRSSLSSWLAARV